MEGPLLRAQEGPISRRCVQSHQSQCQERWKKVHTPRRRPTPIPLAWWPGGLVARTRLATDAPYADLHARNEASGRGTRLLRKVRRVPEDPEHPEDPEDGDADHPGPCLPWTATLRPRWLVGWCCDRRRYDHHLRHRPPTAGILVLVLGSDSLC